MAADGINPRLGEARLFVTSGTYGDEMKAQTFEASVPQELLRRLAEHLEFGVNDGGEGGVNIARLTLYCRVAPNNLEVYDAVEAAGGDHLEALAAGMKAARDAPRRAWPVA
jgi:hypothetical protein